MEPIIFVIIFFIAFSVGSVSSMIGIGGNSIFIPILVFFFGIEIHVAIATLLFSTIFMAISSTVTYAKERVIDYKLAMVLEITTALGAFIATQIAAAITSSLLEIIFGIIMIFVSIYMILSNYFNILNKTQDCKYNNLEKMPWYKWKRNYKIKGEEGFYFVNIPIVLLLAFFAGIIVGLTGVAGGTIKVPLIHLICGAPMILAVGTSFFMIIFTDIVATLGYLLSNFIDFILAIFLITGLVIGAQLGSRTALKVKQRKLKMLFGLVVFAFSILILI